MGTAYLHPVQHQLGLLICLHLTEGSAGIGTTKMAFVTYVVPSLDWLGPHYCRVVRILTWQRRIKQSKSGICQASYGLGCDWCSITFYRSSPQSVGQNKSQGQPTCRVKGNRQYLQMRRVPQTYRNEEISRWLSSLDTIFHSYVSLACWFGEFMENTDLFFDLLSKIYNPGSQLHGKHQAGYPQFIPKIHSYHGIKTPC